jgi:zinc protease
MTETTVMKQTLLALLLLAAPLHAQKINLPAFSRHTLDNGLTILLMEYRKVPLVHLRLMVRGGSAADPEGREGLASVTASLMREGTDTRSATEIARAIDFLGGSLAVSAGLDYCVASAEVLNKDLDSCLALMADVVLRPSFAEEELEREREQRLAGLDAMKEEPGAVASLVFTRSVFEGHPYGRQHQGTTSSLRELQRKDLVAFHRRTFIPNAAVLAVVGDFAGGAMIEKLRAAFGGWIPGDTAAAPMPTPVRVAGRRVILVDKPDATQVQIRAGNTSIGLRSPDVITANVASTVLGGGFTSRLVEELRVKRSLTYGAGSGFSTALHGGSFSASTFTKNETMEEAVDVLLEELKKFHDDGVTAQELEKSQNYIAGSFARSLQSPGALAGRISDVEFFRFPEDHLRGYIERLRKVSRSDVRRVAGTEIPVDDIILVLLGPASSLRTAAEKYGPVTVVPLDEAVK